MPSSPRARGAPSRSRARRSPPPSRAGSRPIRGRPRSASPPQRRPRRQRDRRGAAVAADERCLGVRHAPDRGRERRHRDPRSGDDAVRDRDDGGCADDRDLHLAAVLEPQVGAAGAVGAERGRRSRREARPAVAPWSARGPPRDPRSRPSASPAGERSVADAPKQTSGPPVSIAGEAFIRLPPIVPCARVACEPTIAHASVSAVKRARTASLAAISAWLASAPSRRPPSSSASTPCSSAMRWIATMLAGSVALPDRAPDDEVGAACDRPGAGSDRGDGVLDRGRGGERLHAHDAGLPDAFGCHRQRVHARPDHLRDRVRDRARGRHARWLADALRALRPGVRSVGLDPGDVDLRRVRRRHELVVGQVRVSVAALAVQLRAFRECLADAHHDAAVDLAVGADLVQDHPAVVRGGDLQHADDAGARDRP